jgi:hypothetical protein
MNFGWIICRMVVGKSVFRGSYEVWWKNGTLDFENTGGFCCISFTFFVYVLLAHSFTPVICGSMGLLVFLFVCLSVEAFENIYESLAISRNFVCRV